MLAHVRIVDGRRWDPRRSGLALRMVLAAVLTPLMVLALLVVAVIMFPGRQVAWLVLALVVGSGVTFTAYRKQRPPPGTVLAEVDDPALFGVLSRLCGLADIAPPEVVLSEQRQPNSRLLGAVAASHPPLRARLDALHDLERAQQSRQV